MTQKYFGTDGVRGKVGQPPMTVDFALRMASAAAQVLMPHGGLVVIGKDTRVSGYMFEAALEAGFVAAGVNVRLLGPLPTPGIAFFTQLLGGDLGVVISASHNPYYDNGIKFFDGNGAKLSDEQEAQIEALIEKPILTRDSAELGRAVRVTKAVDTYKEHCKASFPRGVDLAGMKIVVDCAHGAGYKAAPRVLADLGAELIPIGCSPNGRNINADAGSTKPELLKLTVKGVRADIGIALDGDGDRLVMVDHNGALVDGDQLLYVLAIAKKQAGTLKGPVVGTVMSNLGLEHALVAQGIEFHRAKVGDRNVLAMLRERGGNLGGETSGHILCLDESTTGDGIVSALQVLAAVRQSGKSLAELCQGMQRYPQTLINVPVSPELDLDGALPVRQAMAAAEKRLADKGRIVLRPSGTEPLIRVMVEGEDKALVDETATTIADAVREAGRNVA